MQADACIGDMDMKIVIIGGTGLIGRPLVGLLRAEGHEVVAASPSTGIDALTGAGLAQALTDAAVVVDVSNAPSFEDEAALAFFRGTTTNLLEAARDAGVRHVIALSVVGTDRLQASGYFRAKLAQEQLIAGSGMPYTIVRATQFHDFPAMIAEWSVVDGEGVVPPLLLQPIAPRDVAVALVAAAVAAPLSGSFDIAGPRTEDAVDMARRTFTARGRDLPIRAAWRDAALGVEFAGEVLLPSAEARLAPTSFEAWLTAGAH